ncbi:hypothetical protein GCK72_010132 [Caenorhabditis remanei]|uniref:Uncharacterized protein n=1 Tax=Caenorhabditis remanei TaxID=31234 RepID=A0A6A5H5S9_CAERE|nr:hypothetical protein GCK72_010132 [Caenorhabditis remanei]KAF1761873.1 hypothetical protein GCK72_010132 [Caenorhabditis remanei]
MECKSKFLAHSILIFFPLLRPFFALRQPIQIARSSQGRKNVNGIRFDEKKEKNDEGSKEIRQQLRREEDNMVSIVIFIRILRLTSPDSYQLMLL